jgi:hypothetical protein
MLREQGPQVSLFCTGSRPKSLHLAQMLFYVVLCFLDRCDFLRVFI